MTRGDWIVYGDSYGYYALKVDRVTALQVWPVPGSGGRHVAPRRLERRTVLYVGTETDCRALTERLTSSKALAVSEKRAADQRHDARVAKLTGRRA